MSKIKVDPKTFKIMKQDKLVDNSESDSESSTSLYSDSASESIKVIKLDNSEQSGGKNNENKKQIMQPQQFQKPKQLQQFQQPQQPQQLQQPQQPQQPQQLQQVQPIYQKQSLQQPITITNSNGLQLQNSEAKKNVESYLRNNSESESFEDTNTSELDLTESTEATKINEQIPEQIQNLKFEEKNSADIIDLTKSQLHDVLHSIFTDVAGDGISENIGKMSKLFETHNQIMEKILNQLIIMNSNYKQITVPEAIQTNTKQAKNINDFRKNIEKLEKN
jgi:hypothetical protein